MTESEPKIDTVCVALGSNLGDRHQLLDRGIGFLGTLAHANRVTESPRFETDPVDCPPGSEPFLNSVALFELITPEWSPRRLMGLLQSFELEMGRLAVRDRNSPRPLDLDIIFFGDLIVSEPDLVLPHPRASQRRFVLEPLSRIAPNHRFPGETKTVSELLAKL